MTQVTSEQSSSNCAAIVLAAGQGSRMKTPLPKVAHGILGKPMVLWPIDALFSAGLRHVSVVISPAQSTVKELIEQRSKESELPLQVAFQQKPMGTGDAAKAGLDAISAEELSGMRDIIITMGDAPLVRKETFDAFLNFHKENENVISILGFEASNPTGYGRVLHDSTGRFLAIREQKDCTPEEAQVRLCHSGIMCVSASKAQQLLSEIDSNNASAEYYLTDLPKLAKAHSWNVGVHAGVSEDELRGVNTQLQLSEVTQILQKRLIEGWMAKGVQFENPDTVYLDEKVQLEPGVVVEPFVKLSGAQKWESGSRVPSGTGIK